jgi:hypothetical protein
MTQLIQVGFNKGKQLGAISDFTMLPRRFQTGGMRKTAGGECGIDQLPNGKFRDERRGGNDGGRHFQTPAGTSAGRFRFIHPTRLEQLVALRQR